jgi:hypothetical protein
MTEPDRLDLEAPEADAAEQGMTAVPDEYDDVPSSSWDVSEADALEQSRTIPAEDEYR